MKPYQKRSARPAGFTLLELLVASGVLALLVVLVAQILQSGNRLISASTRRLSADSQAREVFTRFGADLKNMPKRLDLAPVLSARNEAIFFYSEAPGFFNDSTSTEHSSLSLIGYRVNDKARLERLGRGLSWNESTFLSYNTNDVDSAPTLQGASSIEGQWSSTVGSAPNFGNGTDPSYHLLADGVFRVFYCFQKKDGTYTLTLDAAGRESKLRDVSALVLTLALLDDYTRKVVNDPGALAAALPDPTEADVSSGKLPIRLWREAADQVSVFAGAAGVPESVAAQVRVYQRSFPLDSL